MNQEKGNNSFKTPEGYFENLSGRVLDKMDPSHELYSGPIPKTDGFGVPETYFATVSQKLIAQTPLPKTISIFSPKRYYYAAAAVVVLFVSVLVFKIYGDTSKPLNFQDLAYSEIDTYWEEIELDISTDEIAEALSLEQEQVDELFATSLENENLLDYLSDNLDEFDEIPLQDEIN